jgi:hypothetical protein
MSKAETFANSCDEAAAWRDRVATERVDERNTRAAEALRAVATWARTSEQAEEELGELLPESVFGSDRLKLSKDGKRVFSTFCFHSRETPERWLARVMEADASDLFEDDLTDLPGGDQR